MLAAGFTEAGFPFGLTVEEYRDANLRSDPRAGWARAKHAIERVGAAAVGRQVDVGFVKFVGSGLSRDAYRACIDDGQQQCDVYALVPNRFAAADYDRRAVVELGSSPRSANASSESGCPGCWAPSEIQAG